VNVLQECFHNSISVVDDAMCAQTFNAWLDAQDELDVVMTSSEKFYIILLSDHTLIASELLWDLLTIAKTN